MTTSLPAEAYALRAGLCQLACPSPVWQQCNSLSAHRRVELSDRVGASCLAPLPAPALLRAERPCLCPATTLASLLAVKGLARPMSRPPPSPHRDLPETGSFFRPSLV
eukprot:CAMPEP_0113900402 /NCGR_PEP_ID=MMETSP0780_2-20120614/20650_1 /TAXON_ID=652834 /ORGANISM="Palpitomonas bilix" /LENGTH=107 /DNA_ID=CAMNT_0000892843 /DNA_START=69 /DNA_END=392 /DNA_ORIENTATION=- /assembly_acc=CAM_ASM_000599